MASTQYSKTKGRQAENAVVEYLRSAGYPHAERRRLAGIQDRGDIAGLPGLVIEVKATNRLDLPGWVRQMQREQANDQAHTGVVIAKRTGSLDVANWYAIQTVGAWLDLYRDADGITEGAA